MHIAKNLQYLRKRDKITQEDLAEKLNVSRQSVSKWETGEAYPETEKLLAICDLFDVSLDGLMRTDLSVELVNTKDDISDKTQSSGELGKNGADAQPETTEHAIFAEHINKFSRGIAIGVMLILLGIAVCIAISGYAFTLSGSTAELTSVMSGVAVILFTAVAVFLFVFNGQKHDAFKKNHPLIEKPTDTTHRNFPTIMAGLVSGILVDVIYLITTTSLIDADVIKTSNKDMAYCYVTAAFMAVLAFIIGGLVYMGIQHSKYDVKIYNNEIRHIMNPTPKDRIASAACGAIMMTATAIYLVIGFVGNYWHPGWVVFPVGGIICGIINTIFKAKEK
ncbi:MAG: helix-turn-helix domain-containing protein [Clostridiales bacterium]|nr:helix-turn-helix domain-containing protein [Clostridiales bacterium]